MPSTPYAKIRIRVNGGAPQTGRVEVSPGDTIQLDAESYDGWAAPVARWEWYSFPDGWTGPGGAWSSESVTQADGSIATVYYWLGNSQPPSFAAPAINLWGKYLCRLVVNDGYKGGAPSSEVVDTATLMEIVSASTLRDLAWLEGNQAGQEKKWARDHQENLRTIDAAIAGLATPYGSTPAVVQSGTGSAGASAAYARGDHSHQLTFATTNTILATASAPISINGQTFTSGGNIAPYFSTSAANPAGVGLLRAAKDTVALAFRNDTNTNDFAAVSMAATNVLQLGSTGWASVEIGASSAGFVRILDGSDEIVRFELAGITIDRAATFRLYHETASGGAGTDAIIQAQAGDAGFDGGDLVLRSGAPGAGNAPGDILLDADDGATTSGAISFRGGTFGEFLRFSYDNSTSRTIMESAPDFFRLDTKTLELDATNACLFAATGSYGGGTGVLNIANATLEPGDITTGHGVYTYGDALKARGEALTVLAPVVETAPGGEDLRSPDRRAKRLTTNDATQTTALTFAIPDNSVAFVKTIVECWTTDGGTSAVYEIRAGVKRFAAGAATLIGTVDVFQREDNAALDATIDVSGNDVRIRVTGLAGTDVEWFVAADVTLMKPA